MSAMTYVHMYMIPNLYFINGRTCGSGGRWWTLKRAVKEELLGDRQRVTKVYSPELWLRLDERPFCKHCIR